MPRKLKILEVCNLDRFAASPYLLPFFRHLVKKGHLVHVACRVTEFAEVLREAGLTVHDIPFTRRLTPWRDYLCYRRLKSLIAQEGFDIVHTHNPKDGVLGRTAAWKATVPRVIHTCNGFYFSHRSSALRKRLVLAAERFAARRCHLVVFVNSEDLALAAARKVVGPGKAKLVYNGVDMTRFHPGKEPELRQELGIPAEAEVIGYLGEIRREKNLEVLIRAVARLLPRHPRLFLVLAGDASREPKEPARLQRLALRLGLKERLILTGFRRDPERMHRLFDIYVLPSSREGFGVTLIEAMASGKPVIACRVRGPREIINDGLDGLLVRDGDPEELADAISFLLESPEAARNITEKALAKVAREFTHKSMHSKLLSVYRA
ncbi:MAG: glycosyltransferase family 4 protein [Actinomycetota bacterium]